MHPHGRTGSRLLSRCSRETPVHRYVGVPQRAMKLRRRDDVMVQRPQRGVAEALVIVPDLLRRKTDADQVHADCIERLRWRSRIARPSDPCAVGVAHQRLESGDQPPGTGPPLRLTPRTLGPVHRQSTGNHHKAVIADHPLRILRRRSTRLVVARRSRPAHGASGFPHRHRSTLTGPAPARSQPAARRTASACRARSRPARPRPAPLLRPPRNVDRLRRGISGVCACGQGVLVPRDGPLDRRRGAPIAGRLLPKGARGAGAAAGRSPSRPWRRTCTGKGTVPSEPVCETAVRYRRSCAASPFWWVTAGYQLIL